MEQALKMNLKELPGQEKIKIVEIEGAIDSTTVIEFDKKMNEIMSAIHQPGIAMIMDFSKLNYINSTGLTKLMGCYTGMIRRSGVLKIANSAKNIQEILNVVGAAKLIKIYATMDEALKP
ncbi:MAG: STAS domain-containing protein [Elusimicrobia bacterium]|nr:STAS domain-containing protein [Elusimicrobiota bacterium]